MNRKHAVFLLLLVCVVLAVAGCSKSGGATQSKKSSEPEYRIIGTGSAQQASVDFLLTNKTGKEITGVSIQAADETTMPANMITDGKPYSRDETVRVRYAPPSGDMGTTSRAPGSGDKVVNDLYTLRFTCDDGSRIELFDVGFNGIEAADLCFAPDPEGVGYLTYTDKDSGSEVSTKEAALAHKEQVDIDAKTKAAAEAAAKAKAQAEAAAKDDAEAEAAAKAKAQSEAAAKKKSSSGSNNSGAGDSPKKKQDAPAQSEDSCIGDGAATR